MEIDKIALKEFYCHWCGKSDFFKSKRNAKKNGWVLGSNDFCGEKCKREREGLENIRKKNEI